MKNCRCDTPNAAGIGSGASDLFVAVAANRDPQPVRSFPIFTRDLICAIHSLWRHRSSLIQMAAEHVLHMQKALDQRNLQLHRVLSDITGVSGLKIMDANLAEERDPLTLARLCHGGVNAVNCTESSA